MRLALRAFALGAFAFAALAAAVALVAAALAEASGRAAYELAPAGVELVSFERTARGTSTELGPGLALLPLAGGILNALAALVLAAVSREPS